MRPTWEEKWQRLWEKHGVYRVADPKGAKKENAAYTLEMFPYPSAEGLHVGHPEGYTASDIYARYLRMNGKHVLHPMGFDSFGLPAENYAIKTGTHPAISTTKNIDNMRRQIKSFGFSYDWDREVITSDPSYYKWTQWIFLKLFEDGLAYESEAPINWCPKDKTGLANEEVVGGKCERCGTQVEKKNIRQWLVKITDERYIERLLHGHDNLDWPESLKLLQRNWIGRSEGAEVDFEIPKSSHYVLLHGYTGSAKANFFPWLANELRALGAVVDAPELPNTKHPDIKEQIAFVKKHVHFTQETIVLGHSLGTVVGMKAVESLRHSIRGMILAGAFCTPDFKDHPRDYETTFDWKFDFARIKGNGGEIVQLQATNDYAVSESQADTLHAHIGGTYIKIKAQDEHFCGAKEPAIFSACTQPLKIFTTRPDTLFGATYMVLSPEHPLVASLTTDKQKKAVEKYQKDAKKKSDLERTDLAKEKTGVFTGSYAINPATGEKIPVWIADYVLATYGTGAIMAVPAHDERDFAFAKKYQLPIREVIRPPKIMPQPVLEVGMSAGAYGHLSSDMISDCWMGDGTIVNSESYNGMESQKAFQKIVSWLEKEGKGKKAVNYKLRDWVFSRQRYWGEPIPIIHCEHCKKEAEATSHYLNFYHQPIWDRLMSGEKTIESRVLNPEEPERYFGKIRKGEVIKFINKNTSDIAYFKVTEIWKFKNAKELFKHQDIIASIKGRAFASVKELLASYESLAPGYAEKLEKNGLVCWKIQRVFPGLIPVPEKDLPIVLPDVKKFEPTGTGESPLAAIKDWVNTKCPNCKKPAKRETNTMPQWAGSNWYFMRYCDPHNNKALADPKKLAAWLPVDVYTGGAEHAVLHFLYARFIYKFLFDIGVVPKSCGDEPFIRVKNQGLIMGEDGQKMSKSRGNVINPDAIVKEFGADVIRMYEMFMGPFEDAKPWDTKGILGISRFLNKVYKNITASEFEFQRQEIDRWHKYVKQVTEGIKNFHFNTCISDLMKWVNEWGVGIRGLGNRGESPRGSWKVSQLEFEIFLKLLAPFAPHIAEELWQKLHQRSEKDFSTSHSIVSQPWPTFDESKTKESTFTLVVMINGKKRADFSMPADATEAAIKEAVYANEKVQTWVTGKKIQKEMYIKGRIYSIVVT